MTVHQTVDEDGGLGSSLEIRRVGLDDYSNVRYLHATSFRALASSRLSEDELASFVRHVYSPHYVDELIRTELFAGFLGGTLAGTAAWSGSDDSGQVARLSSVFVSPMFAGTGIGRRLVADAEARAVSSGYRRITLRATANAVGFFQRLGYEISSYGVSAEAGPAAMVPVTFMRKTMPSLG